MSLILKAIRNKCLECSGQQMDEVRNCVIINCPIYPYRQGKNPFSKRRGNPDALKKAREALTSPSDF